jgi:hypothetical protein
MSTLVRARALSRSRPIMWSDAGAWSVIELAESLAPAVNVWRGEVFRKVLRRCTYSYI